MLYLVWERRSRTRVFRTNGVSREGTGRPIGVHAPIDGMEMIVFRNMGDWNGESTYVPGLRLNGATT